MFTRSGSRYGRIRGSAAQQLPQTRQLLRSTDALSRPRPALSTLDVLNQRIGLTGGQDRVDRGDQRINPATAGSGLGGGVREQRWRISSRTISGRRVGFGAV